MLRYCRFAGCVTALLCISLPSQADSYSYFGQDLNSGSPPTAFPEASAARAAFVRDVGDYLSEGFESFATGDGLTIGERPPFDIASRAHVGVDNAIAEAWHFSIGGRYPYEGENYLLFVGKSAQVSQLVFDFATPVTGFGFHAVDVGDFAEKLSVHLSFVDSTSAAVHVPHVFDTLEANASAFFFGVRTEVPFAQARIRNDALSEGTPYIAFDEVMITGPGQPLATVPAIPEPPLGALWGTGLLVLLPLVRRLRRRSTGFNTAVVRPHPFPRIGRTPPPSGRT